MLEKYQGKHILVVGHAGMMRMIVREVLQMPLQHMYRIQVDNAGITRIRVDYFGEEMQPHLLFHGGSL